MKKITILLVTILLTTTIFAQITEKIYRFDSPTISDFGEYKIISFNNTLNSGLTGEPLFPYQDVKLLLPPGEKAVSIEFIGEDEVILDGSFIIYPQQSSKPISQPGIFNFIKNEQIYKSDAFYPLTETGKLLTQYLNGYSFALTSFTPVKYNPSTGEIRYFSKVTIKITTEPSKQSEEALQNIKTGKSTLIKLQQFCQNPEVISDYPSIKESSDDYEMLIITPEAYISTFTELSNFYLLRGFKTVITSVEDIGAGMNGDDLQEKIRNYIIDEYQNRNIRFVLLGGDTEYIPARGFYGYVFSGDGYEDENIPADLYYSALDGNWNNDNDSRWGEDGEEDLLPEIAVGRFPFSNTGELNNMIHKTIWYQSNPVLGEFNNVLFAGEALYDDPITLGSDYLELLIGNQTANGYETTAIPDTYNIQRLYDEIEYWDASSLMAAINSGKQYVHHVGHADYNYVSFMYNEDITNENFSGSNGINHNYTIFHSHGCICGGFDYNDCILERMVCINNFAVATVGNSRYGWFNEGQSEGPAIHLHREMMDALYDDGAYCIGEAFMYSKIKTVPWLTTPGQWEEGALKWNFYDINILGDPSLAIWTQEPISISTNYDNILPINATVTNVNVVANSLPLAGLTCTVIKNNMIHGVGTTDYLGNAIINLNPSFTEIGSAQLVISGNNCKPTSYSISVENCSNVNPELLTKIKIYPNPANDFINISVPDYCNNESQITIYNQTGQIVYSTTTAKNLTKLDINNFSNGNYIVKIINGANSFSGGFTKN